jgi:CheY-like chemotaxis protein
MAPEIDGARETVLLVEDEVETRLLYEKYLRGSRFQAVAARSVREAEALLERVRPSAIVLDIVLREGDAWDLLVRLKAHHETAAIPVLVITNLAERQKALSLGADAFSNKPVERRWLLRQLTTLTCGSSRCKVLIIDDEEVSRYLLRQALPSDSIECMEACDGAEGLRVARDAQPDAIVLDLLMPDMSGFQVLEQLQADARTMQVPVIISTSRALDDGDRARLSRAGARLLPKSAFSDGTAATLLQHLCEDIGLDIAWGEPAVAGESTPQ